MVSVCAMSNAQLADIKDRLAEKPQSEATAIWLCDTAFSFYANDPALTQRIGELALEKSQEWNFGLASAKAHHVIGISYWVRDLYEPALRHYLDALKYYETVDEKRGIATINLNIGTIYDDLEQSEQGKAYTEAAVKQIREIGDTTNLVRALNNLGVLYANINLIEPARKALGESLLIRKLIDDSVGIARVHVNIADMYLDQYSIDFKKENAREALRNIDEGFKYLKKGVDKDLEVTMNANKGKALMELGLLDSAKSYLLYALATSESLEDRQGMELAYSYLSDLMQKSNRYEEALRYKELEISSYKEQRDSKVSNQIEQLNIQYETEKKERQVAELEKRQAIDEGVRNVLIIGAAAILIIAILLYQRRRKDKEISQLSIRQLNAKIDSKNKEISSFTLSFLQKNQMMEELKEKINEIKKQSTVEVNKELTRINRIVDNSFRADEEWKTFQLTFDQMHDGFFTELKRAYPDISNAELKLCALLRLNMNLKESAKVLGIASDSVKTARYRLRKKLGLNTEDNLVDFLIEFEIKTKS